jgi:hypothetical protein
MRATTFSTWYVSRAIRATMMFELSPLVTAASACARSMPAWARTSRSNPKPTTFVPEKPSGKRFSNACASVSISATEWPSSRSRREMEEPTRPHPTITTCTRRQ